MKTLYSIIEVSGKKYKKTFDNTIYNIDTDDKVIDVLEGCKKNRTRIIIDLGDTKTGISWNETFDVTGYVGRSTGTLKVPLLVYNTRSYRGGSILTDCIIGIKTSKGKRELYKLNK